LKELAPSIFRQRLIIEGTYKEIVGSKEIKNYLKNLSNILKMKTLLEPLTHKSKKYGWAAWIHWENSGCHLYAWESPILFLSVDIYTCKKFNIRTAVNFTKKYFKTKEITFKSV
jgi:hypothetical protein